MIFQPTAIAGVTLIEMEKREDSRGFLARSWCLDEFLQNGIPMELIQGYTTSTKSKGTIRGLHYQLPPHEEKKLVRCIRGSIFEVVVDMRPDSATFTQWQGFTMNADDYRMLLVPPQVAHAVLTLEDNTDVQSFSSARFNAQYERGIRFDDPAFAIQWPIPVTIVSDKDRAWENVSS